MKPILDATAGNRAMWPNKKPPFVVFMDREKNLYISPDIFGDWRYLPFRDNSFSCVLYDPPHARFGYSSVHTDPKGWNEPRIENGRKIGGTYWGTLETGWAGVFYKAQKEFNRVSERLCFKWNTSQYSLERVLNLFDSWVVAMAKEYNTNMRRGKSETHWVTMVRK